MVYCDPPYLISTAVYNEKQRFNGGWSEEDDLCLFQKLDSLNQKGIKFAYSNVFEHKGQKNEQLIEWAKQYYTHYLKVDYSNCNYQATDSETVEVLITNYNIEPKYKQLALDF